MGWPSGFEVDSPAVLAVRAALSGLVGAAMLVVPAVFSGGLGSAAVVAGLALVGLCAGAGTEDDRLLEMLEVTGVSGGEVNSSLAGLASVGLCAGAWTEDDRLLEMSEVTGVSGGEVASSLAGLASVGLWAGAGSENDRLLEMSEVTGVSGGEVDSSLAGGRMAENESSGEETEDGGAGGDPWAHYVPGEYEWVMVDRRPYEPPAFNTQRTAEALNWDPHQLMYFVFEHGPTEGVAACELYYNMLRRAGLEDESMTAESEIEFEGGVLQEVPLPEPTEKLKLFVKVL